MASNRSERAPLNPTSLPTSLKTTTLGKRPASAAVFSLGASSTSRARRPASSSDDSEDSDSDAENGCDSSDSEADGATDEKKEKHRKAIWKWGILGVVIILLFVIGGGAWYYVAKVKDAATSSASATTSSSSSMSDSVSSSLSGDSTDAASMTSPAATSTSKAPASTVTVTSTSLSISIQSSSLAIITSPSSTSPLSTSSIFVSKTAPTTSAKVATSSSAKIATTTSTAAITRATDSLYGPVIPTDFADPGLILPNGAGTWYAYSTSSAHGNVPYATSDNWTNWTIKGDALPDSGSWVDSSNSGIWAPDVRQVDAGYVMYYVGYSKSESNHCIGAATSTTPEGPFAAQASPIICNSAAGGVIDASGFEDVGGGRYVVWKVDGNSLGHSTPIFIQSVESDGYTLQGSATQLLTNDAADGGVTEAPCLVYWDDWYYLFFSSNNYDTLYYDVSYATATSVLGPYTKTGTPLLQSGTCDTAGPGGATVLNIENNYVNAVIHSDIDGKYADSGRAMWQITSLSLVDGVASVKCS